MNAKKPAQTATLARLDRVQDSIVGLSNAVSALTATLQALVTDQNMSVIEGSLGVLPRRILVPHNDLDEARKLMKDAGVGEELEKPKTSR